MICVEVPMHKNFNSRQSYFAQDFISVIRVK